LAKIDGTDSHTEWVAAGGSAVWGAITGVVTDQTDLVTYISGLGYIGDAPIDGYPYVRKNGAWDINTAPVGSVNWGAIGGFISDQLDLISYLSSNYYSITNPDGFQTASDVSTYVTGLGYITDAPSDGVLYARKDAAWVSVIDDASAAKQLTFGVVTTNPVAGPVSAGEVLKYNGTALVWESVPTYPIVSYTVSSSYTNYTLVAGDANNIVYIAGASYVNIIIPVGVAFPIGTTVRIAVENASYISVNPEEPYTGGPYINGSNTGGVTFLTSSGSQVLNCVKVASDRWVVS
jgi:hypothetical protein